MQRADAWVRDAGLIVHDSSVGLAQFVALLESVPTALALFDLRGALVGANSSMLRLYGETRYVDGLTYSTAFRGSSAADAWTHAIVERAAAPVTAEQVFTDFRNRELPVLASCQAVHVDGQDMVLTAIVDISTQRSAQRHLFRLAYYDPVARLHNRSGFRREAGLRLSRANGSAQSIAIALVDIDRFRSLVEALAEGESERILRSIADRLRASVPDTAVVARTGEDEFAILFEHVDCESHAERLGRELLEHFRRPWRIGSTVLTLSASVGIAIAARGDAAACLRDAASAVKAAKERGGASCAVFDQTMRRRAEHALQSALDLGPALERGELSVVMQPIVRLDDRAVVGHEALMRWQHPARGSIPPAEFIQVAEQTGAIRAIDRLALDQAIGHLRRGHDDRFINVNLSARSLLDPDWIAAAVEAWRSAAGQAGRLRMEITETALLTEASVVRSHLEMLVVAGIAVVLDDFGTGYSSLSHVSSFPISGIKVDRSFVARLGDAGRDARIVRAIVTLGCDLGLSVTAEGIETEDQHTALQGLGCPLGQGLLYGAPVALHEDPARP